MAQEINTNITKHESFIERHPRYEFIPLTKEDFELEEWKENDHEYNMKYTTFNDPTMSMKLALKVPFSKEEVSENFLSFNLVYANATRSRSWKGVPNIQSKRQKLKDDEFFKLREDVKKNGETYIDAKIAEVNGEIQKLIDRLNKDYVEKNGEMMLNAFERINTDWIKEEIYDYSEEEKEEQILKDKIAVLSKKLNEKEVARYRKVNDHLADYLENNKDALESIDEDLRADLCQKLRLETPNMPIQVRFR